MRTNEVIALILTAVGMAAAGAVGYGSATNRLDVAERELQMLQARVKALEARPIAAPDPKTAFCVKQAERLIDQPAEEYNIRRGLAAADCPKSYD